MKKIITQKLGKLKIPVHSPVACRNSFCQAVLIEDSEGENVIDPKNSIWGISFMEPPEPWDIPEGFRIIKYLGIFDGEDDPKLLKIKETL